MKLRTRSGSIRLRLTRGEVDAIAEVGQVEERIAFGPRDEDALTYALVASDAATAISARFLSSERRIVVEIPRSLARAWAKNEQVGFEAQQDQLFILIEKDFACLAPRAGTDDVDTFTHPEAGKPHSAC